MIINLCIFSHKFPQCFPLNRTVSIFVFPCRPFERNHWVLTNSLQNWWFDKKNTTFAEKQGHCQQHSTRESEQLLKTFCPQEVQNGPTNSGIACHTPDMLCWTIPFLVWVIFGENLPQQKKPIDCCLYLFVLASFSLVVFSNVRMSLRGLHPTTRAAPGY